MCPMDPLAGLSILNAADVAIIANATYQSSATAMGTPITPSHEHHPQSINDHHNVQTGEKDKGSSEGDGETQRVLPEAERLISDAKSALTLEDFELATNAFAHALEILNANDADPFRSMLAPIYYAYGVALYQLFLKSGVLVGDQVPLTSHSSLANSTVASQKMIKFEDDYVEDDTDTESEEEEERGDEHDQAGSSSAHLATPKDKLNGINLQSPKQKNITKDMGLDLQDEMEMQDESYNDLQVAFEVLDMARVIYTRMTDEAFSEADKGKNLHKLSEVYVALGDVGLESENFDTAFEDYKKAIDAKTQLMASHGAEADERVVAEIYYKMSMALEFSKKDAHESVHYVTLAIELLKRRSECLAKKIADAKGSEEDASRWKLELEDLETLFPDLEAKIEDLKKPANAEAIFGGLSSNVSNIAAPTMDLSSLSGSKSNDLSGLVRKREKREPSTENETHLAAVQSEASASKKSKIVENDSAK